MAPRPAGPARGPGFSGLRARYLTTHSTKHNYGAVATGDPQMLKGMITPLLLCSLRDREDYGYALVVRLQEAGLTDIAEGTVYPALSRCERAGWVEAYYVPSGRGPARKYYRLTTTGDGELTRSLESWNHLVALVSAITSKGP